MRVFFPLLFICLASCSISDISIVIDKDFSLVFPKSAQSYMRTIKREFAENLRLVVLRNEDVPYLQRNAVMRSRAVLTLAYLVPDLEEIFDAFALQDRPEIYYFDFFQELFQLQARPVRFDRKKAFNEVGMYAGKMLENNAKDKQSIAQVYILDHGERTTAEVEAFELGYYEYMTPDTLTVYRYSYPVNLDTINRRLDKEKDVGFLALFLGPYSMDLLYLFQDNDVNIVYESFLSEEAVLDFISGRVSFRFQDIMQYILDIEKGLNTEDKSSYVEAQFFRYSK